jgi:hypothetical protein
VFVWRFSAGADSTLRRCRQTLPIALADAENRAAAAGEGGEDGPRKEVTIAGMTKAPPPPLVLSGHAASVTPY